jgi:hypothetical protein
MLRWLNNEATPARDGDGSRSRTRSSCLCADEALGNGQWAGVVACFPCNGVRSRLSNKRANNSSAHNKYTYGVFGLRS